MKTASLVVRLLDVADRSVYISWFRRCLSRSTSPQPKMR